MSLSFKFDSRHISGSGLAAGTTTPAAMPDNKGHCQYRIFAHFRRRSVEILVDGLCHLLMNAEFCHGVWSLLGRHRAEIRLQTVGHIVLGYKLPSSGPHHICVAVSRDGLETVSLVWTQEDIFFERGDGGTTKSNGIPVLLRVLHRT